MFRAATAKAAPLRVDFHANPWDRVVERLTSRGMSTKCIKEQVPELTMSQISYRSLKAGGVTAYRNGQTDCAKAAIKRLDKMLKECRQIRRGWSKLSRDVQRMRQERQAVRR